MKNTVIRIALLSALAFPFLTLSANAQTDDEFDIFGITNDGTSLNELVPETDDLPPPQPYVVDDQEAPASDVATRTAPASDVVVAPAGPPVIASFDAPSDWVSHEFKGFQFKAPPDWPVMKETSDGMMLFGGDVATRTGATFGLLFEREDMPDEEEGMVFISRSEVTMPNGEIYRRTEVQPGEAWDVSMHAVSYVSPDTNEDDDYAIIAMATMNQPFKESQEVLENILGTLVMPEKYVKPRDTGLNGMVTFDAPKKWRVHHAPDDNQVSFSPQGYLGYAEVAIRNWVTDEAGLDDSVPASASAPELVEIFGYSAMRWTWEGDTAEFFVGASVVPGIYMYYRLTQCLPDGGPVAVMIAGAPKFLEGEELADTLETVELSLPTGMVECAAPRAGNTILSKNLAPTAGPTQDASSSVVIGGAYDVPADWVSHQIRGYGFKAPPEWEIVVNEEFSLIVFQGDLDVPYGLSFGVMFEDKPGPLEKDGMVVLSKTNVVMPNGTPFLRSELEWRTNSGATNHAVNYISPDSNADGLYPWISLSSMNLPYGDSSEILEQILATLTMPSGPAETANSGQLSAPQGSENPADARTHIDIEGASFMLPQGWVATLDNPSDKMFESPDGAVNILAFWWFPDEPLTGYQDDISVKHVMIDHEPVTQITSRTGDRYTVQNVSERARTDEKRFIFTVESSAVSLDEVLALNAELIKSLRLQRALDPNWSKPAKQALAPAAKVDVPKSGTAVAPDRVSFGKTGIGGWAGEFVTLSNPGTGELEAAAKGDGENGYFLAPANVLGDWRGAEGLRLVMRIKSGTGSYYSPYTDGGRGDVFVQSGEMSASIEFDRPVGREWTTQTVSFDDPRWRVSGASSVKTLLGDVTRFDVRAEYLNGDTRAAMASIDWMPATSSPVPAARDAEEGALDASEAWGEDVFTNGADSYTLYQNARYGFSISYPGSYFTPDAPSGSGDGRSFVSVDGQARFSVFAQYEVLGRDLGQTMREDKQNFARITFERVEPGAYQLSGTRDGETVVRRVLRDQDDMTRVFEITYPTERHAEFQAVAEHMAASFGPPPKLASVPQPPSAIAVPQPPKQVAVPQPQSRPQSEGTAPASAATVGRLYTPARGTGERSALMDAARVPVVPAIGQRVIFVVDILNSDGHWAYLQGTPVNPDGTRLNWSRTKLASDWAADAMSEVVMVLIRNEGGRWTAVDWAIGPTDVAWYDWVTRYGLPERLFHNQ